VADDLRPDDGVQVQVDCSPDLAANVNRDLLEHAVRNLGENAAKHTARGSVVLRAHVRGDSVVVEVEDSGPGISPEGFGLGLAIVRSAVRSLDGRIELDSAPGKGTRVRIVLEHARVREAVPA
ncbi:MAG TPA: ATP-binding protein, partial [Gaiellaceae bacterium]|nr:ATP-binding protein [Gaiellaceae bacterium]